MAEDHVLFVAFCFLLFQILVDVIGIDLNAILRLKTL